MKVHTFKNKHLLGSAAANAGATIIRQAIQAHGQANVIVATGASQFEVLEALAKVPDVAWEKVNFFHLDEYVGMSVTHPASFRKYLWERFHRLLPRPAKSFLYLDGEIDALNTARQAGELIRKHPIDVAFVGVGENGHLAFNDPPADFETEEPYILVNLDEACRRQQLGEGWFNSLEEVPTQAISMSIRQVMKSRHLIVSAPDERKAQAIAQAVNGAVTPDLPASIMQEHPYCELFLDTASASKL